MCPLSIKVVCKLCCGQVWNCRHPMSLPTDTATLGFQVAAIQGYFGFEALLMLPHWEALPILLDHHAPSSKKTSRNLLTWLKF